MKAAFKILFLMLTITLSINQLKSQINVDSTVQVKEFKNLEEALKNPDKVYRLNLSDQNLNMLADSIWEQFVNLEYLSLKNDHLKEIPLKIGYLKSLKILDLSGNDFKVLPQSFSRLENLREIYLNDEKMMDVDQSLSVIKDLPNLRILHLENDGLRSVPKGLFYLTQIESLYLNKNRFSTIPVELKELEKLNYIDLHDNKIQLQNQEKNQQGFGINFDF